MAILEFWWRYARQSFKSAIEEVRGIVSQSAPRPGSLKARLVFHEGVTALEKVAQCADRLKHRKRRLHRVVANQVARTEEAT